LLIQGSVQPPMLPLKREDFERAMCAVARQNLNAVWANLAPDADLRRDAEALSSAKFSQAAYNRKR